MGIFDWLFGVKKTINKDIARREGQRKNSPEKRAMSRAPDSKQKYNSSISKNILFKNLKGINFELIDFNPKGKFTANPETFFNIDIDGKWYFTQNQMVFLFKAFSFGTFDSSLNDLLKANNLKPNDYKEVSGIKFWYGNGFKIEVPPVMGKAKHIMITNEDIVPKNSLEFQTTKLVKTTHNVNWVTGLIPYDGAELLKKDFQLNNSLNVPALFKEDGDEYIMIKATTETVAKKLIDKIINANGGLDNFSKGSEPGWFYPHACEEFTVGYLIEHKVVRLNKN